MRPCYDVAIDAPWCSITTTAASHAYLPKDGPYLPVEKTKTLKPGGQTGVKGRNEPADVSSKSSFDSYGTHLMGSGPRQVTTIAWVVAAVKGVSVEQVTEAAWNNSLQVFWPDALQ